MKKALYGLAVSLTLAGALLSMAGCEEAHASPPIEVLQYMPELNSAGDHVYNSLAVSDGTGIVTTVTTGGTFYVMSGTPLAAGNADGSGCITASATTGKFTVAARCGVGHILLRACVNDVIGGTGKTIQGAWHRTRSGSTTQVGPIARATELIGTVLDGGTLAAARKPLGCVEYVADANLSDTYQFQYTSTSNSDTVTTRNASLFAMKLINK